jgi:hypothetical protein
MDAHYPQRTANGNKQGLHYNAFLRLFQRADQADQGLGTGGSMKIVEIGGESAKLG